MVGTRPFTCTENVVDPLFQKESGACVAEIIAVPAPTIVPVLPEIEIIFGSEEVYVKAPDEVECGEANAIAGSPATRTIFAGVAIVGAPIMVSFAVYGPLALYVPVAA